ncbi:LexA repressor [Carboxydothermus pertinax]|uniref:LexA repressor n=1 Tax=Carboxydothermus pertinax TaxID=870242 RepID=A0A1L8CXG6_9THEO|nr:transcriptional repressor LexA [Carboxydothermus pertinax]GAV23622.1 LexA repressor [Carboxydothermus pertinax]
MKNSVLSHQEKKILTFIKQYISDKGYPPTIREICQGVGLSSPSTVHHHLRNLEAKGILQRNPTKPRALEILDYNIEEVRAVPLLGNVAAGHPVLAVENPDEVFQLPKALFPEGDLFALRIKGDSMIEAGILPGDIIIVKKQETAENGDIIVAYLEGEVTVKKFWKDLHQGSIKLIPANSKYEPIIVDREAKILGKVIGLFRKY